MYNSKSEQYVNNIIDGGWNININISNTYSWECSLADMVHIESDNNTTNINDCILDMWNTLNHLN